MLMMPTKVKVMLINASIVAKVKMSGHVQLHVPGINTVRKMDILSTYASRDQHIHPVMMTGTTYKEKC